MKPRLISILTALTALTATSYAAEYGQSFDSISMYSSELQLDIYGAYAFAGNDGGSIFGEDTPGAGAALNLYITRNIGIGLEGMLFDTDGDTMGSAALNLFLRAPLGDSGFAIYGFGGAGLVVNANNLDEEDFEDARDRANDEVRSGEDDDVLFEAHLGIGAEYRFNPHLGIFSDIRHTFVDRENSDYTSARAGLRIAF